VLTDNGESIPAVIIGGYLGAGKTSLVNHLLRHALGLRIAVLVNDFGDLPIDEDLIEGQHGNVMSLSGGCICCSFGADLVGSLQQVLAGTPAPDIVLIETSGVGMPAAVARSAQLAFGLTVEAIVVLVDAVAIREQMSNPYLRDTVHGQLQEGDLVLLNKLDLLDAPAICELQIWLDELVPTVRSLQCSRGEVPSEIILGPQWPKHKGKHNESLSLFLRRPFALQSKAAEAFCSVSFDALPTQDVAQLANRIAALGPGVVRAKGLLTDFSGKAMSLHLAGGRLETCEFGGAASNRLVLIGLRHLVSEAAMASVLR
jgi:G3E family GTPase